MKLLNRLMQFDFFKPLFTADAAAPPAAPKEVPPVEDPPAITEAEPLDGNEEKNRNDESEESGSAHTSHESHSSHPSHSQAASEILLPKIEDLRAHARALLEKAGASALATRMVLRWNPRLKNTAGMAYPGRALITLNPRLAIFGDAEVDRTLRHELGHLLAHERAGRRRIDPHGKEWKQACVDLGLPGESRTHNLPLPRKTIQPRHFYQCPGCGFVLKRVQPLKRKSACVRCCRTHARGRYDVRFVFKAVAPAASPH